MRGAGKSSIGNAAAKALKWDLLDLDEVLEAQEGMSCGGIVKQIGWTGFREKEQEVLIRTLKDHPKRTVISCGGGIVESEGARDALKTHFPVIHVQRDFDDIKAYLDSDADLNKNPAGFLLLIFNFLTLCLGGLIVVVVFT